MLADAVVSMGDLGSQIERRFKDLGRFVAEFLPCFAARFAFKSFDLDLKSLQADAVGADLFPDGFRDLLEIFADI